MSVNVKLSAELVADAKRSAAAYHRSTPKQIEYWSRLGKIAEENPDMPFAFVRDILVSRHEEAVDDYEFG